MTELTWPATQQSCHLQVGNLITMSCQQIASWAHTASSRNLQVMMKNSQKSPMYFALTLPQLSLRLVAGSHCRLLALTLVHHVQCHPRLQLQDPQRCKAGQYQRQGEVVNGAAHLKTTHSLLLHGVLGVVAVSQAQRPILKLTTVSSWTSAETSCQLVLKIGRAHV